MPLSPHLSRALVATPAACLAVGASLVFAPAAWAAPTTSGVVVEAPSEVSVGDTFDVTVAASSAGDAFAHDLAVSFDPAVVTYIDDSATAPAGGFASATASDAAISIASTRLGTSPALTGDIDLVTLTFEATATGSASFALTSGEIVGSDGATIDLAADPAATTIAAETVPSPAATSSATPPAAATTPASPVPSASSTPAPTAAASDDDLTATGTAVSWLAPVGAALAIAAIAGGGLLIARRKGSRA
ncbi:cohesin domain-containing protein [Microbacterium indicum]|uniref:cohesin domain-containing protein n=1 Tax=Microbacterium indicum TaxID=358100 RepID=UPI0003F6F0B5|nr:cohesin domain-containing protein [Microbacterium indicum]